MTEDVREWLLRTIAKFAISRDSALMGATIARDEQTQARAKEEAATTLADSLQRTIGQLTETYGLTEEMAAAYRRL